MPYVTSGRNHKLITIIEGCPGRGGRNDVWWSESLDRSRLNAMRGGALLACRLPDLPGGVEIEAGVGEADNDVGPGGSPQGGGDHARGDDGDVRHGIVAGREKGGAGQAAAVRAKACEYEGAGQIDGEGSGTGQ